MKTRLRQDGGGNREAERGCLFYAWLSFEPTALGRRADAAEGSARPQPRHPSLGTGPTSPRPTWHILSRKERTRSPHSSIPFSSSQPWGPKGPGPRPQSSSYLSPPPKHTTTPRSVLRTCSALTLETEKCRLSRFPPPPRFLDSKAYI